MPPPALSPAAAPGFADCVCFNLRWCNRLVTQFYERRMRSSGLRVTQLPILARLAATPAKMAELGEWLAMERTALLRTLRPLLAARLVASRPARAGRGLELALTAAGRRRLEKARPEWEEAQRAALAAFGERRWRGLLAAMEQAAARLEQA